MHVWCFLINLSVWHRLMRRPILTWHHQRWILGVVGFFLVWPTSHLFTGRGRGLLPLMQPDTWGRSNYFGFIFQCMLCTRDQNRFSTPKPLPHFDLSLDAGLTLAHLVVADTCPRSSPNWRTRLLWLCPKSRKSSARLKSVGDNLKHEASSLRAQIMLALKIRCRKEVPDSDMRIPFKGTIQLLSLITT